MARALRVEYPGAFYHVTSRGNEKKDIFRNNRDREKFLVYLESAAVRYGAIIHVWCLLDNHYHLMLETPKGNLSQIMRHLNGAYTTYFNVKWQRAGHLFQGRYKAILVEADPYATELSRYIHLNPVRAGIVDRPENHPWSSYRSYIGQAEPPAWLRTELILGYFGNKPEEVRHNYRKYVEEIFGCEYKSPLQKSVASCILGSQEFVKKTSEQHLGEHRSARNVPALKELTPRPTMDAIVQTITAKFAGEKLLRNISIYCCQHYSGAKLKEIGEHFGISDAAVSQTSRRLILKAEEDSGVRMLLLRAERDLEIVKC